MGLADLKRDLHNRLWNAQQRWFCLREEGATIMSPSALCLLPLDLDHRPEYPGGSSSGGAACWPR